MDRVTPLQFLAILAAVALTFVAITAAFYVGSN